MANQPTVLVLTQQLDSHADLVIRELHRRHVRVVRLPIRWVNHPEKMVAADYKPYQLEMARACGLETPATLLTNSPEEARSFLSFAAIDMVLTPDDRYVFLELNSSGQWAWIGQATGLPLCETLVDLLTEATPLSSEEKQVEVG